MHTKEHYLHRCGWRLWLRLLVATEFTRLFLCSIVDLWSLIDQLTPYLGNIKIYVVASTYWPLWIKHVFLSLETKTSNHKQLYTRWVFRGTTGTFCSHSTAGIKRWLGMHIGDMFVFIHVHIYVHIYIYFHQKLKTSVQVKLQQQ